MEAPTEIRLSTDKRMLKLQWATGAQELTAFQLRMNSPSAEVKGHFGQGGKVPIGKENITITGLEPVGSYALKIIFADGHQTGLYTWAYLRELGTA
jgi:DUF971 family protein